MVALTAIYNANGVEDTRVHLYYNTQNKNLGIQFRNENDSEDTSYSLVASEDAQYGYINAISQLASTKFNGMELVFGVTEKRSASINAAVTTACNCPPDEKPIDVSLVSPVYRPMDFTNEKNYKIAACSSKNNAWVFYLTKPAGGKLQIKESVIGSGTPAKFTATTEILPGSSLAAYYLKTRYVIYQAVTDTLLREFKVGGSDSPIENSTDAKDQCSFGVTVTDSTVYLYYVSNKNTVRKITKPIGGEWGSATKVEAADATVDDDSQLTICSADGYNHIFYKAVDESSKSKFFHALDPQ